MNDHKVVSHEEWTAARIKLLAREKELTRLRDQVSQQRRELPWVRVGKEDLFDGPNGKESLDAMNGAYQWLDLVPKGRDEADLPYTMAWVRHHDKYGAETRGDRDSRDDRRVREGRRH